MAKWTRAQQVQATRREAMYQAQNLPQHKTGNYARVDQVIRDAIEIERYFRTGKGEERTGLMQSAAGKIGGRLKKSVTSAKAKGIAQIEAIASKRKR